MVKYLPSVIALLLAGVLAGAAMHRSTFECDRTTCTVDDQTFAVADVRDVRFVEGFGKNGTQAETQLVFASGHQRSVGRADTEDARTTFQELRSFFSPDGPPTFALASRSMAWMWLLVVGCVVAAGVLGVRAKAEPETYQPPGEPGAFWRKWKKPIIRGAIFVAAIGTIQLVILFVASKVQGTLVLECKQRCKFQGLECLPGGSSRQSLDEGTYTIEIWASSGSALWIPKQWDPLESTCRHASLSIL